MSTSRQRHKDLVRDNFLKEFNKLKSLAAIFADDNPNEKLEADDSNQEKQEKLQRLAYYLPVNGTRIEELIQQIDEGSLEVPEAMIALKSYAEQVSKKLKVFMQDQDIPYYYRAKAEDILNAYAKIIDKHNQLAGSENFKSLQIQNKWDRELQNYSPAHESAQSFRAYVEKNSPEFLKHLAKFNRAKNLKDFRKIDKKLEAISRKFSQLRIRKEKEPLKALQIAIEYMIHDLITAKETANITQHQEIDMFLENLLQLQIQLNNSNSKLNSSLIKIKDALKEMIQSQIKVNLLPSECLNSFKIINSELNDNFKQYYPNRSTRVESKSPYAELSAETQEVTLVDLNENILDNNADKKTKSLRNVQDDGSLQELIRDLTSLKLKITANIKVRSRERQFVTELKSSLDFLNRFDLSNTDDLVNDLKMIGDHVKEMHSDRRFNNLYSKFEATLDQFAKSTHYSKLLLKEKWREKDSVEIQNLIDNTHDLDSLKQIDAQLTSTTSLTLHEEIISANTSQTATMLFIDHLINKISLAQKQHSLNVSGNDNSNDAIRELDKVLNKLNIIRNNNSLSPEEMMNKLSIILKQSNTKEVNSLFKDLNADYKKVNKKVSSKIKEEKKKSRSVAKTPSSNSQTADILQKPIDHAQEVVIPDNVELQLASATTFPETMDAQDRAAFERLIETFKPNYKGANADEVRKEQERQKVLRRLVYAIHLGVLTFNGQKPDIEYLLGEYLIHGLRFVVKTSDLSEQQKEQFQAFMFGVDDANPKKSSEFVNRFATHAIAQDGDKTYEVKVSQVKSGTQGLKDRLVKNQKHYGMNLSVGGFGKTLISNDNKKYQVKGDGTEGQLYIYNDKEIPGAFLFGIEESKPLSTNKLTGIHHGAGGHGGAESAFGARKLHTSSSEDERFPILGDTSYDKNAKYNGMELEINEDAFTQLMHANIDDDNEIFKILESHHPLAEKITADRQEQMIAYRKIKNYSKPKAHDYTVNSTDLLNHMREAVEPNVEELRQWLVAEFEDQERQMELTKDVNHEITDMAQELITAYENDKHPEDFAQSIQHITSKLDSIANHQFGKANQRDLVSEEKARELLVQVNNFTARLAQTNRDIPPDVSPAVSVNVLVQATMTALIMMKTKLMQEIQSGEHINRNYAIVDNINKLLENIDNKIVKPHANNPVGQIKLLSSILKEFDNATGLKTAVKNFKNDAAKLDKHFNKQLKELKQNYQAAEANIKKSKNVENNLRVNVIARNLRTIVDSLAQEIALQPTKERDKQREELQSILDRIEQLTGETLEQQREWQIIMAAAKKHPILFAAIDQHLKSNKDTLYNDDIPDFERPNVTEEDFYDSSMNRDPFDQFEEEYNNSDYDKSEAELSYDSKSEDETTSSNSHEELERLRVEFQGIERNLSNIQLEQSDLDSKLTVTPVHIKLDEIQNQLAMMQKNLIAQNKVGVISKKERKRNAHKIQNLESLIPRIKHVNDNLGNIKSDSKNIITDISKIASSTNSKSLEAVRKFFSKLAQQIKTVFSNIHTNIIKPVISASRAEQELDSFENTDSSNSDNDKDFAADTETIFSAPAESRKNDDDDAIKINYEVPLNNFLTSLRATEEIINQLNEIFANDPVRYLEIKLKTDLRNAGVFLSELSNSTGENGIIYSSDEIETIKENLEALNSLLFKLPENENSLELVLTASMKITDLTRNLDELKSNELYQELQNLDIQSQTDVPVQKKKVTFGENEVFQIQETEPLLTEEIIIEENPNERQDILASFQEEDRLLLQKLNQIEFSQGDFIAENQPSFAKVTQMLDILERLLLNTQRSKNYGFTELSGKDDDRVINIEYACDMLRHLSNTMENVEGAANQSRNIITALNIIIEDSTLAPLTNFATALKLEVEESANRLDHEQIQQPVQTVEAPVSPNSNSPDDLEAIQVDLDNIAAQSLDIDNNSIKPKSAEKTPSAAQSKKVTADTYHQQKILKWTSELPYKTAHKFHQRLPIIFPDFPLLVKELKTPYVEPKDEGKEIKSSTINAIENRINDGIRKAVLANSRKEDGARLFIQYIIHKIYIAQKDLIAKNKIPQELDMNLFAALRDIYHDNNLNDLQQLRILGHILQENKNLKVLNEAIPDAQQLEKFFEKQYKKEYKDLKVRLNDFKIPKRQTSWNTVADEVRGVIDLLYKLENARINYISIKQSHSKINEIKSLNDSSMIDSEVQVLAAAHDKLKEVQNQILEINKSKKSEDKLAGFRKLFTELKNLSDDAKKNGQLEIMNLAIDISAIVAKAKSDIKIPYIELLGKDTVKSVNQIAMLERNLRVQDEALVQILDTFFTELHIKTRELSESKMYGDDEGAEEIIGKVKREIEKLMINPIVEFAFKDLMNIKPPQSTKVIEIVAEDSITEEVFPDELSDISVKNDVTQVKPASSENIEISSRVSTVNVDELTLPKNPLQDNETTAANQTNKKPSQSSTKQFLKNMLKNIVPGSKQLSAKQETNPTRQNIDADIIPATPMQDQARNALKNLRPNLERYLREKNIEPKNVLSSALSTNLEKSKRAMVLEVMKIIRLNNSHDPLDNLSAQDCEDILMYLVIKNEAMVEKPNPFKKPKIETFGTREWVVKERERGALGNIIFIATHSGTRENVSVLRGRESVDSTIHFSNPVIANSIAEAKRKENANDEGDKNGLFATIREMRTAPKVKSWAQVLYNFRKNLNPESVLAKVINKDLEQRPPSPRPSANNS